MRKYILLFAIISIFLNCNKKEIKNIETQKENLELPAPPPPREIDKNNLIGFACYYSGRKSDPVKLFSELNVGKQYSIIRKKLQSTSSAEKYLATIVCEKLQQKKLIRLTQKELNLIEENKMSLEKMTICSGCTRQEEFTIKEMLTDNNFLSETIERWLAETIK